MEVVSLAQVDNVWWVVRFEENEHGWNFTKFKPAKGNRLKSEIRAKQSAQSKGIPFVNIDFSEEQMAKVVSFVQEARQRKEQRQLEREQRRQLRQQNQEETPPPPPPQNPNKADYISPTTEYSNVQVKLPSAQSSPQALLKEIERIKQQLTETQTQRDELQKEVNQLQQKNKALKKQISHPQEEAIRTQKD